MELPTINITRWQRIVLIVGAILLLVHSYNRSERGYSVSIPLFLSTLLFVFAFSGKWKKSDNDSSVGRPPRDPIETFVNSMFSIVSINTSPKSPREVWGFLMTPDGDMANGYIFGMHDGLLQTFKLRDDKDAAMKLVEQSYTGIFGNQCGHALLSNALSKQMSGNFSRGRMQGGNDIDEFIKNKTPPMGLSRILIGKNI